ncbi:site-2 protease family protein [Oricola thermophila]|uniref:Zinc metalloprotease n=1 Tax=Oricola thermophila TaxID=2742145 RepID=A0A6N1VJL4_9HYPH|nr:site-2 protease family protein [Oricola thermophila]QKV19935.1 site-2 protease family protein [Oricola thermophila]
MQWSFPIARVAGSEIRIHLTFFLLLLWIGIAQFQQGGGAAAAEGVLFIVAVFACVVLHELGHAVAARRYGIRTPRITLLPIGGLAELERMPEKPLEEIVVAIAGPLVNVAIALMLVLILGAFPDLTTVASIENPQPGFLVRLAVVNIVLVLFNLIPAFPMDGGRVLRALLATRYPRVRATEIAATVGQITSFVFGFLGLLSGNVLLIFVAIFVYMAATSEAQATSLQAVASKVSVREGMITHYDALGPGSTLGDAADALLRTTQHEFPVVDGSGSLRGVLTRAGMVAALQERGRATPVHEVMVRDIPVVPETAMLDAAFRLLQSGGVPAVGVADREGRLVGYVTTENVGELMLVGGAATRR